MKILRFLKPRTPRKEPPPESLIRVSTTLGIKHIRDGEVLSKQVIKDRVITTAFVNALVDALQAATYINNWKYHASGTGTNAEAIGDTTLQTPIAEARDAGTQGEGATANIYQTVATHTYAGSFAITEHGLFDAAAAGVLADRTVFATVNVVAGDKIEYTFSTTLAAGG